ncbi:c-type cytochrome [Caulobacter sp. DWR1-3-2b1]|uniref:c-type cytochrome n=1 Tax=Caulobacter sp. DWR1-3-2b1 TaxID=2804670 RepID=UPI003CEC32CE
MRHISILSLLLVAGCAASGPPSQRPAAVAAPAVSADPVARGRVLVQARCAACHAVEAAGDSPVATAPPFRVLSQRYPVANLQEAFAEGISTGHPKMPQIVLESGQVRDLIVYLESIQTRPRKS